jgi:hypothetical protein
MDARLELLIPDRSGIRERIAAAVQSGGGRTRRCRVRRRMPGIRSAFVDITYPHHQCLLSILASLGTLAGVAIRGFDLRKNAMGRSP